MEPCHTHESCSNIPIISAAYNILNISFRHFVAHTRVLAFKGFLKYATLTWQTDTVYPTCNLRIITSPVPKHTFPHAGDASKSNLYSGCVLVICIDEINRLHGRALHVGSYRSCRCRFLVKKLFDSTALLFTRIVSFTLS